VVLNKEGNKLMRHEKKAFTLIEFLVLISIIAILAAIVIPSLHRASMNAAIPVATNGETKQEKAKPSPEPQNLLPPFSEELQGDNPVRVKNPNNFAVSTGIRSGGHGKNFDVPADGVQTVDVPNGKYDIYFVYSDRPDALFQGDSFTLNNNGVEIQIVQVVNGNYNIRQVK
jgi:prepilin-type N-terminal cleavage/methylation domain-containing protein